MTAVEPTTEKKKPKEMPDLSMHCGSQTWFRHWLPLWNGTKMLYTEGVEDLAEKAGAYWLIDAIASHQSKGLDRVCQGLQFWELKVNEDQSCVLRCVRDTGRKVHVEQKIEYTDFPFNKGEPFRIWVGNTDVEQPGGGYKTVPVLYLPQEH